MPLEVLRCADDDEAERGGQADLHHVALDWFAQAHAGVVALGHDVDEAFLDDEERGRGSTIVGDLSRTIA